MMQKMATGVLRLTYSAMKTSETKSSNRGLAVQAALWLALMIGLAYGGSLNAIWTFDDFPNIVHNPRVRIDDLLPETLRQTIYAPQTPLEYRIRLMRSSSLAWG